MYNITEKPWYVDAPPVRYRVRLRRWFAGLLQGRFCLPPIPGNRPVITGMKLDPMTTSEVLAHAGLNWEIR